MAFKFDRYDRAELEACGKAFRDRFVQQEYDNSDLWTLGVFEWFTSTRSCDGCVYPRVGRKGEFLVDYCHASYPRTREGEEWPSIEWWRRALDGSCEIFLAMESEWGKFGNPALSHVMILDDACKLAAIRARVKVMLFCSQAGRDRDEIVSLLNSLRGRAIDVSPWLWIDVPWEKTRPRAISYGVLA